MPSNPMTRTKQLPLPERSGRELQRTTPRKPNAPRPSRRLVLACTASFSLDPRAKRRNLLFRSHRRRRRASKHPVPLKQIRQEMRRCHLPVLAAEAKLETRPAAWRRASTTLSLTLAGPSGSPCRTSSSQRLSRKSRTSQAGEMHSAIFQSDLFCLESSIEQGVCRHPVDMQVNEQRPPLATNTCADSASRPSCAISSAP